MAIVDSLSLFLLLGVSLSLQQRCPRDVAALERMRGELESGSKPCPDPASKCYSVQWVVDKNMARCLDVVTLYYNGGQRQECCDGFQRLSLYPKESKVMTDEDRFLNVQICDRDRRVFLFYASLDGSLSLIVEHRMELTLAANIMDQVCVDQCHKAITQQTLKASSRPVTMSGAAAAKTRFAYEFNWFEIVSEMSNAMDCFSSVSLVYDPDDTKDTLLPPCSSLEDCKAKGWVVRTKADGDTSRFVGNSQICSLKDTRYPNNVYLEFVTKTKTGSMEEARRTWSRLNISDDVTPCHYNCWHDKNYKSMPWRIRPHEVDNKSRRCSRSKGDPGCVQDGSYFIVELDDTVANYQNNKNYASGGQFYQSIRCFDRVTLYYGGPPEPKYKVYWPTFDTALASCCSDKWKTMTISPRMTGETQFRVRDNRFCRNKDIEIIYIKQEGQIYEKFAEWGSWYREAHPWIMIKLNCRK